MTTSTGSTLNEKMAELLRTLDRVVSRLAAIQQTPRAYGTNAQLYSTEIHTIQAIGDVANATVTRLAKRMGVTKGAVSQTVAKLASKRLVRKRAVPGNAREVRIELTDLGRIAYRSHEAFDRKILSAIEAHCGADTERMVDLYLKVLRDFEAILRLHSEAS